MPDVSRVALYRRDETSLREVASMRWEDISPAEQRAALQALREGARSGRLFRIGEEIAVELPDGDILALQIWWAGGNREWADPFYRQLCELAGKDWREAGSFAFPSWPQYAGAPDGMTWRQWAREGEEYSLVPDEPQRPGGPRPGDLWQPLEEDDDILGVIDG